MDSVPPENATANFRNIIYRSKGWITALGWLALAYGILSILKVGVSTVATFGLMSTASLTYPLIISAGSGFLGLIISSLLIPMGIVLINAGGNLKNYLAADDFSAVVAFHGKIRTSAILAVSLLILDVLSSIVTAFLYYTMAIMPGLTGFGD